MMNLQCVVSREASATKLSGSYSTNKRAAEITNRPL